MNQKRSYSDQCCFYESDYSLLPGITIRISRGSGLGVSCPASGVASAARTGGGNESSAPVKKTIHDATREELIQVLQKQSGRYKALEQQYGLLRQQVREV